MSMRLCSGIILPALSECTYMTNNPIRVGITNTLTMSHRLAQRQSVFSATKRAKFIKQNAANTSIHFKSFCIGLHLRMLKMIVHARQTTQGKQNITDNMMINRSYYLIGFRSNFSLLSVLQKVHFNYSEFMIYFISIFCLEEIKFVSNWCCQFGNLSKGI